MARKNCRQTLAHQSFNMHQAMKHQGVDTKREAWSHSTLRSHKGLEQSHVEKSALNLGAGMRKLLIGLASRFLHHAIEATTHSQLHGHFCT